MVRLLKYFLNIFLAVIILGCATKEEKVKDASNFGFHFYQGKPQHMNAFAYAIELDSTNATNWRELSVTYLKRGLPHQWKPYYDKAVAHDAETWQPWRGYLYLWFYRDYEKAIADFNASDTLTPGFIDAPQGHSVDFWRGIAYLGLKDYENSIAYFDKHILKETEDAGEEWVELQAFLYRGIAHFENNELEKSLIDFNKLIHYAQNETADGYYYKAQVLKAFDSLPQARENIEIAIEKFKKGYFNNRPYVETLRQIYIEDLTAFKDELNK